MLQESTSTATGAAVRSQVPGLLGHRAAPVLHANQRHITDATAQGRRRLLRRLEGKCYRSKDSATRRPPRIRRFPSLPLDLTVQGPIQQLDVTIGYGICFVYRCSFLANLMSAPSPASFKGRHRNENIFPGCRRVRARG